MMQPREGETRRTRNISAATFRFFFFLLLVVAPCDGGMKMKSFSCLMRQLDGLPLATGSSTRLPYLPVSPAVA